MAHVFMAVIKLILFSSNFRIFRSRQNILQLAGFSLLHDISGLILEFPGIYKILHHLVT